MFTKNKDSIVVILLYSLWTGRDRLGKSLLWTEVFVQKRFVWELIQKISIRLFSTFEDLPWTCFQKKFFISSFEISGFTLYLVTFNYLAWIIQTHKSFNRLYMYMWLKRPLEILLLQCNIFGEECVPALHQKKRYRWKMLILNRMARRKMIHFLEE